MSTITTDICVIGGGSGGLSVAAGAAQMGANVVLCEGHKMGGDCLNFGCVPSKALIEASRVKHIIDGSAKFGIISAESLVDFKQVNEHVRNVINTIAVHDSVERFEKLGVHVIQDFGELVDHKTVKTSQHTIKAKYIVLATGSRSRIFPIPGLDEINYYTNETIFDLQEKPKHFVVVGGGPIGCELAQAYSSLGCKVSIIEAGPNILGRADIDCINVIKDKFKSDGINIYESANIKEFIPENTGAEIKLTINNEELSLKASHILIATGRTPNIEKLKLSNAEIAYTDQGITVNSRLRTSKKNVYAIGDIASPYQFTHTAGYHAGIVIRNILFKLPAKVNYSSFPWVIYVNPELAHVGIDMQEAKSQGAQILQLSYKDNDRAQAGLHTNGLIKVAVSKKGYIMGATIVGESAGELISQWTLAITNKLKIKHMAGYIIPYPTLSELNKRTAGSYYTEALFSNKTKKIVRFLMKLF
ncbi:MAG: pyruvate/2-oxoglutarate dehydrogenase complex dihydrolipoamide dehydrogenase (E3) component [Francisellaceae bacterium]|jgi:pyruvate/2-oxoglutarate dehydrogenase complex dihydrolipoamide dehydrogenase (E3) component